MKKFYVAYLDPAVSPMVTHEFGHARIKPPYRVGVYGAKSKGQRGLNKDTYELTLHEDDQGWLSGFKIALHNVRGPCRLEVWA